MDLDVGPDDFGGSDEGSHYMSSKQGLDGISDHIAEKYPDLTVTREPVGEEPEEPEKHIEAPMGMREESTEKCNGWCFGCSRCWCFEHARSRPCPEQHTEPTETLLTPLEVLKAGLLCLTSQYEQMGAQLMVLCEALCLLEDGMQNDSG